MTQEKLTTQRVTPAGNHGLIIGIILGVVVLILLQIVLLMISDRIRGEDKLADGASVEVPVRGFPRGAMDPAGQSIEAVAARIATDSNTIVGLVGMTAARLAEKDAEIERAQTLYTAAAKQLKQLQAQFAAAGELDRDMGALKLQMAEERELLVNAGRYIEKLKEQLAGATDETTVAQLRQNLAEAQAQRDSYFTQLGALRANAQGMVDGTVANSMREQLAKLEPENEELRYEVQRLRSELNKARLFVDKVDDLPVAAKELYIALSKLETVSPEELKIQYAKIEKEIGARVIDTVAFQTGLSRIDLGKVDAIAAATANAGSDSYFLVVGYASKTGSFEANKTLSEARSTTVASVTDVRKKGTQGVNAVFFGQTDRFSPSNVLKNQICEVWEIER